MLGVIVGCLAYEAGMRAVKKLERFFEASQFSVLPVDHPRDPTITSHLTGCSALYTAARGHVKEAKGQ
jgi:hypothetical protein